MNHQSDVFDLYTNLFESRRQTEFSLREYLMLCREDPTIRGIATDVPVADLPVPRLSLDDIPGIAGFVLEHAQAWPS